MLMFSLSVGEAFLLHLRCVSLLSHQMHFFDLSYEKKQRTGEA